MKEEFLNLFDYIINSNDEHKMHVLGNMVKSMMNHIIATNPTAAQDYIDVLQSVKWHNYLTHKEADQIIANMTPKPMWGKGTWEQAMSNLELQMEKEPYYNKCALYVTMSMITSDSGETLSNIMGLSTAQAVTNTEFIKAVYKLALDKLEDKDQMFNIRTYFKL